MKTIYKTNDLDVATFLYYSGHKWETETESIFVRGRKDIKVTFIFYGDERMFNSLVEDFMDSDMYQLLQTGKELKKQIWRIKQNAYDSIARGDVGSSLSRDDDDYDNAKQDGKL